MDPGLVKKGRGSPRDPLRSHIGAGNTYKNRDTFPSRRLSEDGHGAWVPSEAGNVLLDPAQCSHLVQVAPVSWAVLIACAVGKRTTDLLSMRHVPNTVLKARSQTGKISNYPELTLQIVNK